MEFGSETEIRRIMNNESKEEAQRRTVEGGENSNKTKEYQWKEDLKRGLKDITNKQSERMVVVRVMKS